MSSEVQKVAVPKFPLRLMPTMRRTAEQFSAREGISLNQFINLAVAEKLAHLEHAEWARKRKRPTKELLSRAISLLEKGKRQPVEPGDELPEA